MNYMRALKTFLWGLAGALLSLPMLSNQIIKFILGYPLLILSCMMFVLSAYQFYQDNKK